MILVFIFLGIIILLLSIFIILLNSTIQIQIKNLKLGNRQINNPKTLKDKYEVKILIYFLEKIPILYLKLNNKKMRKIYSSKQLEKIDFKKIKNKVNINKYILQILKQLKIKQLKLIIDIGSQDAVLTAYIVGILSSLIGIILPHITNQKDIKNCIYIVNPIYKNENKYNISLDSIIQIKIVHIIYSMLILGKKGMKKDERTSNRRSYAYNHE